MNTFLFSLLSAVGVGIIFAFASITYLKSHDNLSLSSQAMGLPVSSDEANEEDPSFISHFSRVFIYSAEKDEKVSFGDLPGDIIESQKNPVSSLAYSVTDMDTGMKIFEKDSDRVLPIASITKLVTAVVAKKFLDENEVIAITSQALATEGDTGRFRLGEGMKVKDILYPLLMVSSNDAAEALARSYGREKFIKEMNIWANSIGAYRTYFRDPSGISPKNLSTANDIYIIAEWIRENEPEIFEITLTKAKSVRFHTWVNPTHFLNLSEYAGGKNGYTTEADRTSVSLFYLGFPKHLYSIVLLGSKQRDTDTLSLLNEILK